MTGRLLAVRAVAVMASATAAFALGASALADPLISLGAPVTVTATDSNPGTGYNNGTSGNVQNITNGVILPDATSYGSAAATSQAVEWNGEGYVFQITLGGLYNVSGILVDADDNDAYYVDYFNSSTSQWDPLYTAPIVSEGFGLRTRPTPGSNDPYEFATPVVTDAVEIFGGPSLDDYSFGSETGAGGYAVAQVELFGTPFTGVPEPAAWATMLLGMAGIGAAMRMSRRKNAAGFVAS